MFEQLGEHINEREVEREPSLGRQRVYYVVVSDEEPRVVNFRLRRFHGPKQTIFSPVILEWIRDGCKSTTSKVSF